MLDCSEHDEEKNEAAAQLGVTPRLSPDFDRRVYCLLGIVVDAVTPAQAVERIAASIRNGKRCFLVTPNMSFVTASRLDQKFWNSILRCDLSIADGMPIVWMSRLLGLPIRDRVAGSNMFESLIRGEAGPLTMFFLGGVEGAARAACERISGLESSVRCSGYEFPGFRSVEEMSNSSLIHKINRSAANVLTVSVGLKKGQFWIARNEKQLTCSVVWYGGAAVNFAAGTVQRAPSAAGRFGLEWLWRIKEEPHLWRRYAADLKTLLWFLAFRLIPCVAYQIINRPDDAKLKTARLEIVKGERIHTLCFSGHWTERNLKPARDALRRAAEGNADLILDFENLRYADAAFLGLIMIAHGYQSRVQRSFSIRSVGKKIRTIFRLHACDFLMSPPSDF